MSENFSSSSRLVSIFVCKSEFSNFHKETQFLKQRSASKRFQKIVNLNTLFIFCSVSTDKDSDIPPSKQLLIKENSSNSWTSEHISVYYINKNSFLYCPYKTLLLVLLCRFLRTFLFLFSVHLPSWALWSSQASLVFLMSLLSEAIKAALSALGVYFSTSPSPSLQRENALVISPLLAEDAQRAEGVLKLLNQSLLLCNRPRRLSQILLSNSNRLWRDLNKFIMCNISHSLFKW